jgi:predicted MPP superfamily phosphohydrolase
MMRRLSIFKKFLIGFTILVDAYTFIGILDLMKDRHSILNLSLISIFCVVSILFLIYILRIPRFESEKRDPAGLSSIFLFIGVYILFYLPKLVFVGFRLTEDVIWFSSWIISFPVDWIAHVEISPVRWNILSIIGLAASVIPFLAILWGLLFGRFHYQVEKTEISFHDLPDSFDGLRIVQLSDIHLGSVFGKHDRVKKAIEIVNSLNPDLVLFTGDLVNNYSEEAHGWENLFKGIKARYGKFSVLGNHDYGDYWEWNSGDERQNNMQMLYKIQHDMGFHLLLNESDILPVNGDRLALIGVENWGLPPFKQYGDLEKSLKEVPASVFKILLSHDPSHWDAEIREKTNIQLTLSGHTHAMQFGFRHGKFKWSPSQYIYKRWMGLYQQNGQALYVNRGMGFIGFPGRIGMRPEIALLVLKRKMN